VAGGALIEHVSWVFYVLGGLVFAAGIRMFRSGAAADPPKNPALRGLRQVVPVTSEDTGTRLFARVNGRTVVTPLLVALIAIETTDLVFALDSIPAVFGITREVFLVFTSNAAYRVSAMATGRLPTLIAVPALPVVMAIGVTVSEPLLTM
jgi:tellurite resistance protein TerC